MCERGRIGWTRGAASGRIDGLMEEERYGSLHTSAYVSIRQLASAYVSIRQHTSA